MEFLALSVQVIETLPKGYSALVDQLKRASWSIPLNIAEGAVKKIRVCGLTLSQVSSHSAHDSAMDCAAIINLKIVVELLSTKAELILNLFQLLSTKAELILNLFHEKK